MTNINFTDINNFNDYLQAVETGASGFFMMAQYMVFLVVLTISLVFGFEVALLIAAFTGLILSLLLAYAGLVAWWVVGTYVGIILFSVLKMYFTNPRE
jgi:uncharacterized oligopeptide transporter (OPT) family protein